MHFLTLISSLVAVTSVVAAPADATTPLDGMTALSPVPIDNFGNIDPQFSLDAVNGCGVVVMKPSGNGRALRNDNQCYTLSEEIRNFWIAPLRCTCIIGKAGKECSNHVEDWVGFFQGPWEGRELKERATWVQCFQLF